MKFRIAIFALLFSILLPISVLARPAAPPQKEVYAPNEVSISVEPTVPQDRQGSANTTVSVVYTVRNFSTNGETIDVTVTRTDDLWGGQPTPNPPAFILNPNATSPNITVDVNIPPAETIGRVNITTVTFTAVDRTNPANTLSVQRIIRTTVTPPPTATPPPTVTAGSSTPTPANVCNGGGASRNDGYEPDNSRAEAKRIEVDVPQQHALCPVGDEDWLIFGGLEGKVYTIDVPTAVDGLDPSLTLYDERGNQLAFNDDFPRGGDTTDVKPRIQSWRAPANGQYYIKVRDAAGRGFLNALYTIVLQSESYGPTPTLIPELCSDLYEPDGLPQLAPLMVTGETHQKHRLCPKGDADWVKFFAKSGKVYTIFTSNLTVGADTVMILADRDGTTILDFNDDFGATLESRIDFAPQVDGFYYAQIKNVGDVGNQFIEYTLSFQIKSNANQSQPTTGALPTSTLPAGIEEPTATSSAATATLPPGITATATSTLPPYPTNTPQSRSGNKLPDFVVGQAGRFADPAFANVWERADAPIAANKTSRSWLWGPRSGNGMIEAYYEAEGGVRQVQYFDKSRMEITYANGDRTSQWFVTNGLIAKELIVGQIQLGDNNFVPRSPAQINIAGDLDDNRAPTYASFSNNLAGTADRTGQFADQTLNRDGSLGSYAGKPSDAAKLVTYVPQTQHNIASAFWEFINRRGLISENGQLRDGQIMDWVFALGYPISEPYWVRVRVGGVEQDVLVQAFERRVLTYTPNNSADWRVEMGNVGQHYEQWRYK